MDLKIVRERGKDFGMLRRDVLKQDRAIQRVRTIGKGVASMSRKTSYYLRSNWSHLNDTYLAVIKY